MLAAFPDVADADLAEAKERGESEFVSFVIDHGLGPLWHSRTDWAEFRGSRMSAEALFLAQNHALEEIDAELERAGIEYAVIKGAASRKLLYENPALRACHDLDLLVRPADRVAAVTALVGAGFTAQPEANSISRELVLSRDRVNIDLHWSLLREGRLRTELTPDMLARRRKTGGLWMLSPEDSLFVLLVHPAFAKHLAGWGMGLHRVVDIINWVRTQDVDWQATNHQFANQGVQTAAWATLRWVEMLIRPKSFKSLDTMMSSTRPGPMRRAWLDRWLRNDLSERTSNTHIVRLAGFSLFLHDALGDSMRALAGRRRAYRRSSADLAAFRDLTD